MSGRTPRNSPVAVSLLNWVENNPIRTLPARTRSATRGSEPCCAAAVPMPVSRIASRRNLGLLLIAFSKWPECILILPKISPSQFIRNRRSVPLGPGRRTRVPEPPRSIDIHKFGLVKFWQPMTASVKNTHYWAAALLSASPQQADPDRTGSMRRCVPQADIGNGVAAGQGWLRGFPSRR